MVKQFQSPPQRGEEGFGLYQWLLEENGETHCDICGDYHDKDSVPISCESGDGL